MSSSQDPSKADDDKQTSSNLQPIETPVFNCIVYVSTGDAGGVRARVANLAGIQCTAANERAALGKIVPAFKQQVADFLQRGESIPWIDPPEPPKPQESTRWVPTHL